MTASRGGGRPRIIAATLRLIARDGVAAVTTRAIAREADVSLATLHYGFASKDDLLLAALDEATSATSAALAEATPPGEDLHQTLTQSHAALCALADREARLPLVRCELLLFLLRQPAQAPGARAHHARYLDALAGLYGAGQAGGAMRLGCCRSLAELVAGSLDGLAISSAGVEGPGASDPARQLALRAVLALVERDAAPTDAVEDTPQPGGDDGRPDIARESLPATRPSGREGMAGDHPVRVVPACGHIDRARP